ncbi:threonine-phosphate decarboxylase [Thiospirochaeta perfilievii]|uniref:threonine-phosphate decarboxylase n=1 Tax=Thiospirochaeta perfilievii TaxID=252967 RepID=A0A5C1Q9E0_9SPIO|nr:threonine-phosphate decarboxylase CobD [Thiospirochaeta perfilievii]QEN04101.1 threonine-phosphate decarboxylase [Thiospirochaeta perfilievii]
MYVDKDFTHGGNIYKASEELNIPKSEIIDFSANINPLGPSKKGVRGVKKSLKTIVNYPDPNYVQLKKSLSKYYLTEPDNILLGNGAIELIYKYTTLKKGGRALIPAPGFVEYEKALLSNGWDVSYYSNKNDIVLDAVDVVFICNPNNPTGSSYSTEFLISLLERSKNRGIDLFIDEAFIEFSSYKSLTDQIINFDNLYILKSLTKFFAIPGLRLGCLLTTNIGFINAFYNKLVPWSINSLAQEYIIPALRDKVYIKKSKKYIKRERVYLYRELSKFKFLCVYASQGNYIFFKVLDNRDIMLKLKESGILIRSCSNYNNLDSTYYRVAVKKRVLNKKLLKILSSSSPSLDTL